MMLTTKQLQELFLISHRCLSVKTLGELAGLYDHFSQIVPFGFAIQAADRPLKESGPGSSKMLNFRIDQERVEECADEHNALRRLSSLMDNHQAALSVLPVRACPNPGFLFRYSGDECKEQAGSYMYMSDGGGDYKLLRQSLELLAPHLNAAYQRCASPVADVGLTAREQDVLRWLRQGKSNWDISKILDISEHTVKFHLRAVCRKLNVQNRVQVVAFAEKYNLVS